MAYVSEDKLRREIEEDERREILEEEEIVEGALTAIKMRRLKKSFAGRKRRAAMKKEISRSFEKGERKLEWIRQRASARYGREFVDEVDAKISAKEKQAKTKPEQRVRERLKHREKLLKGLKLMLHPIKLATGRSEIEPLFEKKKRAEKKKEETAEERRNREQSEAMAAIKRILEKSQ